MNKLFHILILSVLVIIIGCTAKTKNEKRAFKNNSTMEQLAAAFQSPPNTAKPGVYWYLMDGNQNKEEMTKDLESMARVGIARVIFLEVNIGMARGPVDFMSTQWQDNFAHAVKTAERLNMEVILGTGPGWSGSGGPWINPEDSMQHLVANATKVSGPVYFEKKLEVPKPPKPNQYSGMNAHWEKVREDWYRDVRVVAFPTPKQLESIAMIDLKTLKDVAPYTVSKHMPPYVPFYDHYPATKPENVVDPASVIDISNKMTPDSTLTWEVPDGDWTIMRFVTRTTGQTTRPAPGPGHGFETDKFSPDAFLKHWDNFQGKLLQKVNPGKNGRGWTQVHLDSWEMSAQNWSENFIKEFTQRRGYDPLPYFPAYTGAVVGSHEITERFLWDLRITAKELVIENYALVIKAKAHQHGMTYSNQPYDMNPAGDIDFGAVADLPSCEFWDYRVNHKFDALYSCIEATSIAHTMGKAVVSVEAFTSSQHKRFHAFPGQMKNQTDWALALGMNNFIFHTFQHQPLGDDYLPGMSMGPYGLNWHRHQNWWEMLGTYHNYVSRASHVLQQGIAVADILYVVPEGAPHIFLPPTSAMHGKGVLRDKRGYAFDAVTFDILRKRAKIKNGFVSFKNASQYRLLVLPNVSSMTPEALETVEDLLKAGANVLGNAPKKSPSLVGFPDVDKKVQQHTNQMWGSESQPEKITSKRVGKGTLYYGKSLYEPKDDAQEFYPAYSVTADILDRMDVPEDFIVNDKPLRFAHRHIKGVEAYFVSNRSADSFKVSPKFRVSRLKPELWNPNTGEIRALAEFTDDGQSITVPLSFEPNESFFIVFSDRTTLSSKKNISNFSAVMNLDDAWQVNFNAKRGGPESIAFNSLIDWRDHSDPGVRFYSGTAIYNKEFNVPDNIDLFEVSHIDIGNALEMAKVILNGRELGVVWTSPGRLAMPTGLLKKKNNRLEIHVANSWENRLIGDSKELEKYSRQVQWPSGLLEGQTFTTGRYTFSTYLKNGQQIPNRVQHNELTPSGLLGPVRLLSSSQQTTYGK